MKILAIDAATEACSVAVKTEDTVINNFELCPQSHSLVLLPMVDETLTKSCVELNALDFLAFGQGPGSFTGVRIGIGVAQGLGYAASCPLVGVSTLQTMAQQVFEDKGANLAVVAIDARMSEVYLGIYKNNGKGLMLPITDDTVLAPDVAVKKIKSIIGDDVFVVAGTGWGAYSDLADGFDQNKIDSDILYPNAKYMLKPAVEAIEQGRAVPAMEAQPVYVRDTVSWKKLPGR